MKYLAIPYSHPDEVIRDLRAEIADSVAAYFAYANHHIFSPISHWHHIAKEYKLETHFDYWKSYNYTMLARCDRVIVVKIGGWKKSLGVQQEIEFAKMLHIPVRPTPPEDCNVTPSLLLRYNERWVMYEKLQL
jgi:hypothetical protein